VRKRNQIPQARLHHEVIPHSRAIAGRKPAWKLYNRAGRIETTFRNFQSIAPDVARDNVYIPAVVIPGERFAGAHSDRVGFLAGRASRAPNPQWAQCLAIISPRNIGKYFVLQNFEKFCRPKEARVSVHQCFQQKFAFARRAAHICEQLRSRTVPTGGKALCDGRGQNMDRLVNQNARIFLQKKANLG
jgi:hypothetical protein